MEITKIELKILIKKFLTASNRILSAGYEMYPDELLKFTRFLETQPLIWDFIISCGEPEFDIKAEVDEVHNSYGNCIFDLGSTNEKEVANIYAVIKHLADIKYDGRGYLFYGYSHSKSYQDKVNGFGENYIRILITHIESHLTTLSIKMGVDEKMNVKLEIKGSNLSNTQLNLASEGSSIVTTKNNINSEKIDELIKTLLSKSKELSIEHQEVLSECIETIETLKEEKPKKGLIKTALKTLQGIAGTTEFVAAVTAIVQFVENVV